MALGPRAVVEAPQLAPGRRGLLAAAQEVTEPDERWVNGFAFAPEACDVALISGIFCEPPGAEKIPGNNPGAIEYDPYALIGWDACSTLQRRDRAARARRLLLATESDQMESELWDGAVAFQEGLPNRYLADSNATDLGSAGATAALAELEQELAECLHGQRGMIHATVFTATVWTALGLLRVEGGLLLTGMDTIVVAGSGYSGSAPAADDSSEPTPPADITAAAYAYATGLVYVRRGAIVEVGDGPAQQVARATNDWEVFVERPAAAVWNGCCQLAIEVDHTTSGVGTP